MGVAVRVSSWRWKIWFECLRDDPRRSSSALCTADISSPRRRPSSPPICELRQLAIIIITIGRGRMNAKVADESNTFLSEHIISSERQTYVSTRTLTYVLRTYRSAKTTNHLMSHWYLIIYGPTMTVSCLPNGAASPSHSPLGSSSDGNERARPQRMEGGTSETWNAHEMQSQKRMSCHPHLHDQIVICPSTGQSRKRRRGTGALRGAMVIGLLPCRFLLFPRTRPVVV